MKTFIAAICSLFLLSCASFATTHRAVTFSALIYESDGGTVARVVINNIYLITNVAGIARADAHLYAVAINQTDGEVDVINKTTGAVAVVVMAGLAPVIVAENTAQTEQVVTAGVEMFGNSSDLGTAFSQIRKNASGDIIYDHISFYAGDTNQAPELVLRGTCVTGVKEYPF